MFPGEEDRKEVRLSFNFTNGLFSPLYSVCFVVTITARRQGTFLHISLQVRPFVVDFKTTILM